MSPRRRGERRGRRRGWAVRATIWMLAGLLAGCAGGGPADERPLDAQALLDHPARYDGRRVVVTGYLASGMEHVGFGPTLSTARGSWIWVSTGGARQRATPEGFWNRASTQVERVTIRGTFHAGPDGTGRGYGHLNMFNHKLDAGRIVFHPRGERRRP